MGNAENWDPENVQKYESAGINLKKEKVEEGNNAKKWK
jgi:hypothetical protein